MGLVFDIVVTDVDETHRGDETPSQFVERLALDKARVGLTTGPTPTGPTPTGPTPTGPTSTGAVSIGADTCVVRDGDILGKPRSADDARTMLRSLSGRDHYVHTGVAMVYRDRVATSVETTIVTFNILSDATIDWYISTGEAFDKAGSYGMQGYGGVFVERIAGSPSNVIGLPLHVAVRLGVEIGMDLNRFRE